MQHKKVFSVLLPVLLLAIYALFLAHPINLATADLGRHLRNGQELFQKHHLITTNFYSYTFPDFPVTNHHWGAGALFYLVFRAFGFAGVHLFFIALALAAFFVFFQIAKKYGGLAVASLLSFLIIPLLGQRVEVRPEIISYLFAGIFFWCLLERKWLWLLPLLEIFWVNSHIYFFLGPAVIGAFLLGEGSPPASSREASRAGVRGKLTVILLLTVLATLINPFFLQGAIAPFTVFQNYGYNLAENQPLWKIEVLLPGNPNYLIFKIVLALLIASFIWKLWRDKQNFSWVNLFLALGFSVMGLLQLRNFALFGLFALPIIASNFARTSPSPPHEEGTKRRSWWILATVSLTLILAISGELSPLFPQLQRYRIGLAPGVAKAAEFWKDNQLKGPIFNNYDIGGYLIFTLDEKVFVDNRPEAYPASFFTDEYIPMQENEEAWRAALQKYNFNAIFFWWRDFTPWSQKFLAARAQDPQWRQVYLDDYVVIFVRNSTSPPTPPQAWGGWPEAGRGRAAL